MAPGATPLPRRVGRQTGKYTSVSLMISPELRHSFLLSSSTVFMFSIQTASTGPSNMYHFLLVLEAMAPARMREGKIPSVLQPPGGGRWGRQQTQMAPRETWPPVWPCSVGVFLFSIFIHLKTTMGKMGLFSVAWGYKNVRLYSFSAESSLKLN